MPFLQRCFSTYSAVRPGPVLHLWPHFTFWLLWRIIPSNIAWIPRQTLAFPTTLGSFPSSEVPTPLVALAFSPSFCLSRNLSYVVLPPLCIQWVWGITAPPPFLPWYLPLELRLLLSLGNYSFPVVSIPTCWSFGLSFVTWSTPCLHISPEPCGVEEEEKLLGGANQPVTLEQTQVAPEGTVGYFLQFLGGSFSPLSWLVICFNPFTHNLFTSV